MARTLSVPGDVDLLLDSLKTTISVSFSRINFSTPSIILGFLATQDRSLNVTYCALLLCILRPNKAQTLVLILDRVPESRSRLKKFRSVPAWSVPVQEVMCPTPYLVRLLEIFELDF